MLKNTIQYQIYFWNSFAQESVATENLLSLQQVLDTSLINLIIFKKHNL